MFAFTPLLRAKQTFLKQTKTGANALPWILRGGPLVVDNPLN
jgi:hypothetical protein